MEPLKNLINADVVRKAGASLARTSPTFDRKAFERRALNGLDGLEMKARAMQIADALEATLPATFDEACGAIEQSLAAPLPVDGPPATRGTDGGGLAGWIVWPLGEFVARRGMNDPERALRTLHALTQRFSAEFAIRPFIVQHQDLTLATLLRWTRDPSAHVRRLCSEGSRPRLPWGLRLQSLVAEPTPALPILAALQDDPSEYVRRSVANHLNDIAKDHPALVIDWVKRHLPGASAERQALLRHASRTLIKQGHRGMLALWGASDAFKGQCTLKVTPTRVAVGDSVTLALELRSTSGKPQALLIDYAVHHVKAHGGTHAKVFKGWTLTLDAHEARRVQKRHSFRAVTTRRYQAGPHAIEVLLNGSVAAQATVQLSLDRR